MVVFLIQYMTANSMKFNGCSFFQGASLKKGENKNSPTSWAMFSETPKDFFPNFFSTIRKKSEEVLSFMSTCSISSQPLNPKDAFFGGGVECCLTIMTKEVLLTKNGHTKSRRNVW